MNKIAFQRGQKLTVAVKGCLKTWFKIDSLTRQQKLYAENFANKVPVWYKKCKNEKYLFTIHEGMCDIFIYLHICTVLVDIEHRRSINFLQFKAAH